MWSSLQKTTDLVQFTYEILDRKFHFCDVKGFLRADNKPVFDETGQNIWKQRKSKLINSVKRRNHLESEVNYYSTKYFSESEMRQKQVQMNKPT